MTIAFQYQVLLSVDPNFKLKSCPRDPVLKAGQDGVEGVLSDSVELDIDNHEMPPLIGDNEEDNLTLQLSADDIILKVNCSLLNK
ncbi:hypothetical protein B0H14DRAFT_3495026 [Mycena olivaceomarginata]|nr:hypothetical protein B0H14DRAFT_3495026 [Mycena olivaceomarginata]